jgi:hypothetical protein
MKLFHDPEQGQAGRNKLTMEYTEFPLTFFTDANPYSY